MGERDVGEAMEGATLKPCPFCGNEDSIFAARDDDHEWLYCDLCGAAGPSAEWVSGPEAVRYPWATAAWNRRAALRSTQEETEPIAWEMWFRSNEMHGNSWEGNNEITRDRAKAEADGRWMVEHGGMDEYMLVGLRYVEPVGAHATRETEGEGAPEQPEVDRRVGTAIGGVSGAGTSPSNDGGSAERNATGSVEPSGRGLGGESRSDQNPRREMDSARSPVGAGARANDLGTARTDRGSASTAEGPSAGPSSSDVERRSGEERT